MQLHMYESRREKRKSSKSSRVNGYLDAILLEGNILFILYQDFNFLLDSTAKS
jgi:hypothetical protein